MPKVPQEAAAASRAKWQMVLGFGHMEGRHIPPSSSLPRQNGLAQQHFCVGQKLLHVNSLHPSRESEKVNKNVTGGDAGSASRK
jgi:hypothetical protein